MWDELGIAPCQDPKAIRRAYAARLKKLDPDRDPEAFARLRGAFEWALDSAGEAAEQRSARPGHDAHHDAEPATDHDAQPAADDVRTDPRSQAEPDRADPAAEQPSAPAADGARKPELQPSAPPSDPDDIRDSALLIALDAALRRRDANEATVLYYRAAATGALSLERAPDVILRLLDVAVDDPALKGAAFRPLVRAAGLDASRSRALVDGELRQRVLARLRAEDWYDDLLATAGQRKGRSARRRAKIARLLLGRIGRHWRPRVDKAALRISLAQYRTHEAWLKDRIDPVWVSKLEGRLRRRDIFWYVFYILFVGGILFDFLFLSVFAVGDLPESLWSLSIGLLGALFLAWILKLLLGELIKLSFPGWRGFAGPALIPRVRAFWARGRTLWHRSKAKKPGDAGER